MDESDRFLYNSSPAEGFYCIYKRRPGQAGIVPDCPDIPETLTTHAQQLCDANVDYVVVDATNLFVLTAEAGECRGAIAAGSLQLLVGVFVSPGCVLRASVCLFICLFIRWRICLSRQYHC